MYLLRLSSRTSACSVAKAIVVRSLSTSSSKTQTGRRTVATNLRTISFFDSASDYFDTLRWRATEALTSLMSKEEREVLLKRMNAIDESAVAVETQKTIAEAVVAARAEEARRLEARWEREKAGLHEQAEKAAYERVEADIRIQQQRAAALQKWQADVAQETAQVEETNQDHHPILGKVVEDFGYKRVHVVSAKTLSNIPVWKKQRIYRHDRAKAMALDKLKSAHFGLPGVIALHEDSDGKLSILDGQHRVGMMTILHERQDELDFDLDRILVEVFPQSSEATDTFAQDIFTEINKAEPVKLVDMPGVAKTGDRNIITQGATRLAEKNPEMFKPSQQCRSPHLNVDNLRDALFASDVIKRHQLKSPKALEDWMMQQNDALRQLYADDASKVSKMALEKARKHDFYLGLDSSWLYN